MSLIRFIIKLLKQSDQIDTINSETKEFIEENGVSKLLEVIDKERSYDKKVVKDIRIVEEKTNEYKVESESEKSYTLKRVGSKELSSSL